MISFLVLYKNREMSCRFTYDILNKKDNFMKIILILPNFAHIIIKNY